MPGEATIEAVRLRPVWGGTCWEALVFLDVEGSCLQARRCFPILDDPRQVVDHAINHTIDEIRAKGGVVTNHRGFYMEHLEEIERKCKRCRRMSSSVKPAAG